MGKKSGAARLAAWLASGHTQAELAERIEASQTAISLWKRGKVKPSREFALAIERVTEIPVEAWST